MTPDPPDPIAVPEPPAVRRKKRHVMYAILIVAVAYLVIAYVIAPMMWKIYAWRHPSYDDDPRVTETSDHHRGDPLNVSLIGTEEQIHAIMKAAGWYSAAALGIRSDIKIGVDTVLKRPDDRAPVSNLYLYGRKEDLAFEQPVGNNPRQRHHVRFWKSPKNDADGRPVWIGSASYDEKVGLSHTTGQITHHIAPDVDKERDHLFENLEATGDLSEQYPIDDFHTTLEGRNGGGDRWFTDGDLYVGVIKPDLK
jgi:hypothetical protein